MEIKKIRLSQIDYDKLDRKNLPSSLVDCFNDLRKNDYNIRVYFYDKVLIHFDDWEESVVAILKEKAGLLPKYGCICLETNEEIPLIEKNMLSISLGEKELSFYRDNFCGRDLIEMLEMLDFKLEIIDKDKGFILSDKEGSSVRQDFHITSFSQCVEKLQEASSKLEQSLRFELKTIS